MALEQLDFDHREMTQSGGGDADKNLAVKFYLRPLQNQSKSEAEGRPIFEDTEMIEIRVRGDRGNVIIRPVREGDKRRFRDAWRDFKDEKETRHEGTLLSEWPIMTQSQVEELKFLHFFTVEQLAAANDDVCSKVAGMINLKAKAKAYIDFAKGTAPMEQYHSQLVEERNRREAAERNVADLAARLTALESKTETSLQKLQGGGAVKK